MKWPSLAKWKICNNTGDENVKVKVKALDGSAEPVDLWIGKMVVVAMKGSVTIRLNGLILICEIVIREDQSIFVLAYVPCCVLFYPFLFYYVPINFQSVLMEF